MQATPELLSRGSFGDVYKCADAARGFIARKVCMQTSENEVHAMTLLKANPHANVVRVLDVALATQARPCVIYSMELCDMDLFEHLSLHGPMREPQLRTLAQQLLAGLLHCMNLNIYHGDLKPENILMRNGVPKLTDFGFASFTPRVPRKATMTLQYAAPELVCAPLPLEVDLELVDVWTFGMTLAVCATASLPMSFDKEFRPCRRFVAYAAACREGKHEDAVRKIVLSMTDAADFSADFQAFLYACLAPVYTARQRFAQLAQHAWLSVESDAAMSPQSDDTETTA